MYLLNSEHFLLYCKNNEHDDIFNKELKLKATHQLIYLKYPHLIIYQCPKNRENIYRVYEIINTNKYFMLNSIDLNHA